MLVTLLTICVVVFIYLHIVFHWKTSNDLEVFDMEGLPDKKRLEELCNLRQPLLFDYDNEAYAKCAPTMLAESIFDLNVVDPSNVAVPLKPAIALPLFKKSNYYTVNNQTFLKDSMLRRVYEQNDSPLRPPMTVHSKYDLMFGGKDATTPLKYTDCCRNYFMVNEGEMEVKLAVPNSDRFLNVKKDYVKQEFYSETDAWGEQNKVKFLTLKVKKGQLFYLPAYWWYSFKLSEECFVCSFSYKTAMNVVATLPDTVLGIMQRQKTKMVSAKKIIV